ncbi:MAG: hypothetical protein RLZZ602_426, partial [Pseudomonadota bacterium]
MITRIFTTSALAVAISVAAVGVDKLVPGVSLVSEAAAQDQKKDTRETRRTPALRNKVYEKLAEAQTAAEAKDFRTAEA